MAIYEDLNKEELLDLLKAYESYIVEASNSNAFQTGWTPVCIEEFYTEEYQGLWKKGEDFSNYFYEAVDFTAKALTAQSLAAAIDTFYWVYDSYNYMDEISDRTEAITSIENDILSGKIGELKEHLQAEIEERAEANSATLALKMLISQLDRYQNREQSVLDPFQKPFQKFSDISDDLLKDTRNGLDVWVTSTEGEEVQFADIRLQAADYDRFSSKEKWLFDLPVENVHRNGSGNIDSVVLNSGLTSDALIFLMDLDPALLHDDNWVSLMQCTEHVGLSFDERLAYLRERNPAAYLEQIEDAFDAVANAVEAVDQAETAGLKLHPSIGNRLSTAQMILSDVLETVKEEAHNTVSKATLSEISAEMVYAEIKKQLENGSSENEFGEPQAFFSLVNGRSIEVTLEQYGLEPDEQFYSVRLHCNSKEFDNGDYRSTMGVIEQFSSIGPNIEEVSSLVSSMLHCNNRYPVSPHSLLENSAHTEGDIHFDQVVAEATRRCLQQSAAHSKAQIDACRE